MSTLFGIPVPSNLHWYAKDLSICIYNKERKCFPDLTDQEYMSKLRQKIQRKYEAANGTKTLIEVLKEEYERVKKEGK